MKTLKLIAVLMLGLFVASCDDDEKGLRETDKISSEEQAEIVASSVGQSGFIGASEESTDQADDATSARVAECGYTDDGEANLSGTIGSISFSYMFEYEVALECANEEPQTFTSDFIYEGSFESPRFESDYSGAGSLAITQLSENNNHYKINGSYDRDGSFASSVGDERSGSNSVDIDANDILIRKADKKVTGGSAKVTVKGQVTGQGSYVFDARIKFHDDGTATITVDGDEYLMIVATGEVSEKD